MSSNLEKQISDLQQCWEDELNLRKKASVQISDDMLLACLSDLCINDWRALPYSDKMDDLIKAMGLPMSVSTARAIWLRLVSLNNAGLVPRVY